jgi:DnaJ-class molecular chaperone
LVVAAAGCCGASFAVAAVQAEYNALFEPYLAGCEREQATSQPHSNRPKVSSDAEDNPCPECADAYELLELPFGAGKDAVSSARRELAKSFHPDVFGNRRGARVAEEQLKRINEASDHLLECQKSNKQTIG